MSMSTSRNPPGKLQLPKDDDKSNPIEASPNAKSIQVTVSQGQFTNGLVNQHPAPTSSTSFPSGFKIGISEDRNRKCRRTMEDSHAFVYDFGGVKGQGYFAIFDGHAGKHAAEWCGKHFHDFLLSTLRSSPNSPVPDILNLTFHSVDAELSSLATRENTHSGCTAVTAFLRLEDASGRPAGEAGGLSEEVRADKDGVTGGGSDKGTQREAKEVRWEKRTLYTANVGDARAILCRAGKAVRLTYDHKGSDAQEAKRITDAGGFVMNNRVNGVLAVTRSLGDSSMKEFVVGSPYTTETTLLPTDEFLIVACDGLWDVCDDQKAVDLIRAVAGPNGRDPQEASKILLDHALTNFSTDNLSVLVVSFG